MGVIERGQTELEARLLEIGLMKMRGKEAAA
jgi:hypothetical protein